MEQLIWFSMPGAVLAAAIVTVWPKTLDTEPKAIAWVVLVPAIGFIVHQLYRLLFESTGGYARKARAVIQHIMNVLAPRVDTPLTDPNKAFLVWEIAFYSEKFPAAFRDHNRGAWHYVMSFWGISLSGVISSLLAAVGFVFVSSTGPPLFVALGELLIAVLFYFKGRSTYKSLVRQEVALAYTSEELFLPIIKKLKEMR